MHLCTHTHTLACMHAHTHAPTHTNSPTGGLISPDILWNDPGGPSSLPLNYREHTSFPLDSPNGNAFFKKGAICLPIVWLKSIGLMLTFYVYGWLIWLIWSSCHFDKTAFSVAFYTINWCCTLMYVTMKLLAVLSHLKMALEENGMESITCAVMACPQSS